MPTSTHPFFDREGTVALAHQGGGDEAVENSTAAFTNAGRLGYRYLDIDLQVTSDGVLVAHHDERLDRLTDLKGRIDEMPWSEVSEARLPNSEPLARFEDLLDAHADARWNIEIKSDSTVTPTVDLLRRRGLGPRVCLSSFNDLRMRRVRKAAEDLNPAYATALLSTIWLKITSYVPVLNARFVDRAHRVGLEVIAWTIDEPAEMHRLLDLEVDGILTDAPTQLRTVLADRGQWA
jgi:glycerophosphoryl diester phosphodiesterase